MDLWYFTYPELEGLKQFDNDILWGWLIDLVIHGGVKV